MIRHAVLALFLAAVLWIARFAVSTSSATSADPCPCCANGCCCCCDYSGGIPESFTATVNKISGPSSGPIDNNVLEGTYTLFWNGGITGCAWAFVQNFGFPVGCQFVLFLTCVNAVLPRTGCAGLRMTIELRSTFGGSTCFNAAPVVPDAGCTCSPPSFSFTFTIVICDIDPFPCGVAAGTYVYQIVITP